MNIPMIGPSLHISMVHESASLGVVWPLEQILHSIQSYPLPTDFLSGCVPTTEGYIYIVNHREEWMNEYSFIQWILGV